MSARNEVAAAAARVALIRMGKATPAQHVTILARMIEDVMSAVKGDEREACAVIADNNGAIVTGADIRARGAS